MAEETNQLVWAYLETLCPNIQTNVKKQSARQLAVLLMVGAGRSTKAISLELGISTKTIESHREGVKTKLGIHDYRIFNTVATMLIFREWVATAQFEKTCAETQVV